jgi:threonine/homoserine/homoserine lactone efflux protein
MAMVNANPRTPSIIGIFIGAALLIVGVWLLISEWEQLLKFLKIFGGLFLTLFGLGILTASAFARRY